MSSQMPFKFDVPSVTELTTQIKQILESKFNDVLVEGEMSNVKRSRNGHLYFTVKDQDAQMPCVMWRSTAERADVELADGKQVILGGSIQVYAPHGRYQMIVTLVEQAGIGRLQQAFEQLKQKLQREGLFDEAHKKQLPKFPERIGIITSSAGAALQDILSTLRKRWPLAKVALYHASVQGLQAAPQIARGIRHFCDHDLADVLIIGRGGGSLEDLWPFNEEQVARAIFDCPVPVISAVGHEVDFSISDFVADARAATPTHAAVLATPDINEIRMLFEDFGSGVAQRLEERLTRSRERVARLGSSHALLVVSERIRHKLERLNRLDQALVHFSNLVLPRRKEQVRELQGQLEKRMVRLIPEHREQLTEWVHRLEKMDPNAPLEKGFVRDHQEERWVRSLPDFEPDTPFELEWSEGKRVVGEEDLARSN